MNEWWRALALTGRSRRDRAILWTFRGVCLVAGVLIGHWLAR
jgi:hypothetical protein